MSSNNLNTTATTLNSSKHNTNNASV